MKSFSFSLLLLFISSTTAFLPPLPHSSSSRSSLSRSLSRPTLLQASLDDDDLTDRSFSILSQIVKGLNKELPVPTALLPPRASESGTATSTSIKGWFPLSMGLALTVGNPVYPAAFIGFLFLSRPTDAPDIGAAVAAALVAGVVNPLLASIGEATGLDDSFLARIPFFLGVAATGYVLFNVLGEGKEVFADGPKRAEKERIPIVKEERDIKFFDVKMKNKSDPEAEADIAVEVKEKRPDAGGNGNGNGGGRWHE